MRTRTTTRRDGRGSRVRATVVAVLVAALALPGPIARADDHVETFVAFDPAAGQFPEGVAVDKTGNVYVSLVAPVRQIRKIDPSGKTQVVLADFNDLGVEGIGPAGLTVDARRTVHVAVVGVDLETFQKTDPEEVELPDSHGVYRVQRDGTTQHLAGTEKILFPNDVTLDRRGNVYVTDTIGGAVWRIPRGGTAERWLQHDLLEGDERFQFGFPIGANGIVFRHNRSIIVANTERGLLVEIPIQPDGRAGTPNLLVQSPQLVGVDGIALDARGDAYAATGVNNTVIHIADGGIETLATRADGLNQPSTLAFGRGRSDRQSLFVANFSLLSPDPTPGVLRLRVGSCRS